MIEAYAIGNVKFDKLDNRLTITYKRSKKTCAYMARGLGSDET